MGEHCTEGRLAACRAPPDSNWKKKTVTLKGRWRLPEREYRQAVWSDFAWRRVGRARQKRNCVLVVLGIVWAMMIHLDQEMLCHEGVGSWKVVNMWWYERGGSYPVTLTWGYERGRFVCSMLTLRDATCEEVRGWWITVLDYGWAGP